MSELVPYLTAPFVPVKPSELTAAGIRTLAVNLVDYQMQPGLAAIKDQGGLATVLNWPGKLMTFAGAFGPLLKVKKNTARVGIHYVDPHNQAKLTLTPEQAAAWQQAAQAQEPVAMYQTPDYYAPVDDLRRAVEANRTWAQAAPGVWYPVLGAGLTELRQASLAARPARAGALLVNLPPASEQAEWQRIVTLTQQLLPAGTQTAVVANDLATIQLAHACQIDRIITPWPLKAGWAGKVLVNGEVLNLRHHAFATDVRQLGTTGFQLASLHQMLHANVAVAKQVLALANLQALQATLA